MAGLGHGDVAPRSWKDPREELTSDGAFEHACQPDIETLRPECFPNETEHAEVVGADVKGVKPSVLEKP